MPKRTNDFQQLIALIEAGVHLLEGKAVESVELIDKITGEPREVDIVVSLSKSPHPILIGVECQGGSSNSRPATVEWVERMWGKHTSLPTDKLVLVAKGGFTEAATKKAAWLGVELLSLGDAKACDWNAKIHDLQGVEVIHFIRPYVTRATLVFRHDVQAAVESDDIDLERPILYAPDGTQFVATELAEKWVTDPSVIEHLEKGAFTDTGTAFQFERNLKPGVYVVGKSGAHYPVVAIAVEGKCRKKVETMRLAHAVYGEALVAHGVTSLLGKDVRFVVAERRDTQPTVTVAIPKKEKS